MRKACLVLSCGALGLVVALVAGTGLVLAQTGRPGPAGRPAAGLVRTPLPGEPASDLCGAVPPGTRLTRVASPYTVTCDATVSASLEIEAGVEIRFDPGTALTVDGALTASGTPTQPITFTSNQATPQPGDWDGLRFEGAGSDSRLAWCVVEYATVGLHLFAGPGTTLSPTLVNCTLRYHSSHGIVVEGYASHCSPALAQPSIAASVLEHNGGCGLYAYGHGDPAQGCSPPQSGSVAGTLLGSTIRHNQASGICLRSRSGYYTGGDVSLQVEGNNISANALHGIFLYGDDAVHPRIENNLVHGNGGAGIRWEAVHEGWDLAVMNNTVVANGQEGLLSATPAGRMQVRNNIFLANEGAGLSCLADPVPQGSHNDLWLNTAGSYSGCPPGTADLSADPLLVDAAHGNFHLQFGSPCIDAGTASSAPAADADGIPRPQGNGFDIGAYEFWAPEIVVKQAGLEIESGATYEFGRVGVGESRAATFAVENVGTRALAVESIEVVPAIHFALILSGTVPLTVAPGASTTFDVRFAPLAPGEQSAALSIVHDDRDESPYTYTVAGQAVQGLADLALVGPSRGLIQAGYPFTASVGPADATLPITYTWRATSLPPPWTHTAGLSDRVTFTWDTPGVQAITVTARNIHNALTRTHLLTLYTPVRAGFYGAPTSGEVPLLVTFTNTSRGDYTASRWQFGDGLTGTLSSPAHTYRAAGVYTVTLEVDGPGGNDRSTRRGYIAVQGRRLYLPVIVRGLGAGLP